MGLFTFSRRIALRWQAVPARREAKAMVIPLPSQATTLALPADATQGANAWQGAWRRCHLLV